MAGRRSSHDRRHHQRALLSTRHGGHRCVRRAASARRRPGHRRLARHARRARRRGLGLHDARARLGAARALRGHQRRCARTTAVDRRDLEPRRAASPQRLLGLRVGEGDGRVAHTPQRSSWAHTQSTQTASSEGTSCKDRAGCSGRPVGRLASCDALPQRPDGTLQAQRALLPAPVAPKMRRSEASFCAARRLVRPRRPARPCSSCAAGRLRAHSRPHHGGRHDHDEHRDPRRGARREHRLLRVLRARRPLRMDDDPLHERRREVQSSSSQSPVRSQ